MKRSRVRLGTLLTVGGLAALSWVLLWGGFGASKEPSKKPGKNKETVTYANQVSRILQDKCQTCHHPGTAAPFTIATYDDAVNWGDTFREVLADKRMPPWHADPRYGAFSNDRRLHKDEMDTLLKWLD